MHKMLLDLPIRIETQRLVLRPYKPGDGSWFFPMSHRNRDHLSRYEADNAVLSVKSTDEAEVLVRELAAAWVARSCFFLGVFDKTSDEFVAQIYIGPINWELPDFSVGFFADVDHQGQGFVTEAATAVLQFVFIHLHAHRVQIECDDTNLRSCRLAERCGFIQEGHFRENKRNTNGHISGTLFYGMLRSEYERIYES
ncbi:MAG: GNAT family N-acetyltransferase [Anaerolineales bacterium]|nr:GNAT family N-acetyltransferase [Anaerolineales bacterium]